MIITIAGLPGSGKTSVAKLLAKRLNMGFHSVGDMRGRMAMERGLTIDELNALGTESNSDVTADEFQKKLAETEDDIIIEGRISWFFIPQSFKILMSVDPVEGARRIYEEKKSGKSDARQDERTYASVDETKSANETRLRSDTDRYRKLYGIENFVDPTNFDLVIDTTNATGPEENADRIIAVMRERGLLK